MEPDPVEQFLEEMYANYNPARGAWIGVYIVMPSGIRLPVPAIPPHLKPWLRGPVPKDLHDYNTGVPVYYHKDCTRIFKT